MPFALVFIGIVLVVTGARGTMRELGAELKEDFTGAGNFTWWIVSILSIGALGYIPEFQRFSRWFMFLILLAMIISNRGFFNKLIEALQGGPEAPKSDIERDAFLNNSPTTQSGLEGLAKGTGDAIGSVTGNIFADTVNSILGAKGTPDE